MNRTLDIMDDEPGKPVRDDLGDRASAERNDRCAASHRLDHDHSKRFRPVNREQQRTGITEKFPFLCLIDLTDELYIWSIVYNRLNHVLPIGLIDFVDLGRNLEWQPYASSDSIARSARFSGDIRPRKAR